MSVGPKLSEEIQDPVSSEDWNENLIERNPNSMFLTEVEEKYVIHIVNKCKYKTSTDCNDVDLIIVKKLIEGISKPVTYICDLLFQTGKFPNKMKIAKVVPLYKTGDRHNFSNYRSVSLLPQLSKILEKIFNNRLDKFLEGHKSISDSQYRFRPNSSKFMALIN